MGKPESRAADAVRGDDGPRRCLVHRQFLHSVFSRATFEITRRRYQHPDDRGDNRFGVPLCVFRLAVRQGRPQTGDAVWHGADVGGLFPRLPFVDPGRQSHARRRATRRTRNGYRPSWRLFLPTRSDRRRAAIRQGLRYRQRRARQSWRELQERSRSGRNDCTGSHRRDRGGVHRRARPRPQRDQETARGV